MKEIILLIVVVVALYWFLILRPGRLDFWSVAAKHPDAAYEHLKADPRWRIFEDQLPENYQNLVPKSDCVGPFRLLVPKLGNKAIRIFGERSKFEQSQNEFLGKLGRST